MHTDTSVNEFPAADGKQIAEIVHRLKTRHGWRGPTGKTQAARCVGKDVTTLERFIRGKRRVDPTVAILLYAMDRDPTLVDDILSKLA